MKPLADDFSLKGVLRRPCLLTLAAVCGVVLWLNLRGIGYGLPAQERLRVTLGGEAEMVRMLPAIRSALRRNIAERSEAFDKTRPENFTELARLSPYFDQVRSNNPDEFFIFKNLSYMAKNRTPVPSMFNYGPFYYYQVGGALFIGKLLGLADTSHSAEYYLLHPEKMAPFYLAGRALSAVLLTLTVGVVFLIGHRLGGLPAAAFSSLLLGFLPLVNLAGKAVKPEASLLFFSALTLLFAVPVLKRVRWSDYLWSGIFIGLAAAVKYPGVFNCSYLVMFHLIRRCADWKKRPAEARRYLVKDDGKLIAAGVISAVAFFAVNFAVLLNFSGFFADLSGMASVPRPGNVLINLLDSFLCYFEDGFRYTLGIPAAAAITCAMLYHLFRPSRLWLGCLPGMLLFLYLASIAPRTSDAYCLPALIPLCLIAGDWLFSLKNRKLGTVLAVLIILGTFSYCWAYSEVTVHRNIRLVAAEWINEHLPAGSTICTLRYPVFYRVPMVSPRKYKLVDQFVQGNDIIESADYYVQTSYQWEPAAFLDRLKSGEDRPPAPGFKRIKEFEIVPKAFFGLLPLTRDHRLNHYFENIMPKIIIFKAERKQP
ncbi:MAG: glycosyltransferase family 39 protein [Victivallaceae bacterium]|nr:glycosyltransferase family 39 protein [Victivallaceae bacterium]